VRDVWRRNDETQGTAYDLHCTKHPVVRHVEIKDTTGTGDAVMISANQRRHAATDKDAESYLFVLRTDRFEDR
jgi:hypothetical protein